MAKRNGINLDPKIAFVKDGKLKLYSALRDTKLIAKQTSCKNTYLLLNASDAWLPKIFNGVEIREIDRKNKKYSSFCHRFNILYQFSNGFLSKFRRDDSPRHYFINLSLQDENEELLKTVEDEKDTLVELKPDTLEYTTYMLKKIQYLDFSQKDSIFMDKTFCPNMSLAIDYIQRSVKNEQE